MVRREVVEGVGVMRTLQRVGVRKKKGVSGEQATQIPPFKWENSNQLDSLENVNLAFSVVLHHYKHI